MPRVRMEFSKGDQVRFLSHLDIVKAFERAIRRAGIPIAFSEGFNPHPKMNFASALAVGVTSDREYIDIELRETMAAGEVMSGISGVLPAGIKISGAMVVPDNSPALMAIVNRADYRIIVPLKVPLVTESLTEGIARYMNSSEVMIMKLTKKGFQPRNIRPGIKKLAGAVIEDKINFSILTVTGSEGNVRPEEVVRTLADYLDNEFDADLPQINRAGLYTEHDGRLLTPMDMGSIDGDKEGKVKGGGDSFA
ncbi:TIGR03936 family radical SAM-associated protein [Phosphitispora fastidiosa]|uniref:TIGR03936 family radical SAM-associated protein n=1 Tax=Phosphitispora fastidiosa TaxID=2837202 RepID=UPI001E2B732C|nr:TIGR03936 family radical SAM-associated protein [Phosphitispora fastidiosa]MBU7008750.1 radical SAM-linked protein [Phosphitispora fastidiosa]